MSQLEELRRRLRNDRPVPWEQMPDFGLYMDQVLSYMDRQIIRFEEEDALTSAMVNNYTKSGLVPRAEGKKYGREHLAYLTAICILKRVMSTRDMDLLIREELRGRHNVEDGYAAFRNSLDKALNITADEMDNREKRGRGGGDVRSGGGGEQESGSPAGESATGERSTLPGERETASDLADDAIHFALLSYAAGIASQRYVALLRREKAKARQEKMERAEQQQPSKKARKAKTEAGKQDAARAARKERA